MTDFHMVSFRRAGLEEFLRFVGAVWYFLKCPFIKKKDDGVYRYISEPYHGVLYKDGTGYLYNFDRTGEPDQEAACSWRVGPDGKIDVSPEEWVTVPYFG